MLASSALVEPFAITLIPDGLQNVHPLFVHFPIALLSVGFLFDLLGYFLKIPSLAKAGWWCFGLGVVSAIVTVFTGLQAEGTVALSQAAQETLEMHEHFQLYSTVVFVGLIIWRSFRRSTFPPLAIPYFAISAIAVLAILYGSHYGGKLVYNYGVGTALNPAAAQNATPSSPSAPESAN